MVKAPLQKGISKCKKEVLQIPWSQTIYSFKGQGFKYRPAASTHFDFILCTSTDIIHGDLPKSFLTSTEEEEDNCFLPRSHVCLLLILQQRPGGRKNDDVRSHSHNRWWMGRFAYWGSTTSSYDRTLNHCLVARMAVKSCS